MEACASDALGWPAGLMRCAHAQEHVDLREKMTLAVFPTNGDMRPILEELTGRIRTCGRDYPVKVSGVSWPPRPFPGASLPRGHKKGFNQQCIGGVHIKDVVVAVAKLAGGVCAV